MIPKMETSISIRQITDNAEMRAVEELQKVVWGIPDLEIVPASHLIAAVTAGGVLLGAFDAEKLVGFVYGFVGYENSRVTHHSHMLAVKPEYRNFNLGEKLKWAQRDIVLSQGITKMSWTFDPLQSLNAYFNFNKLGVIADHYIVDFYGADAASFLHQNSTDRFWVTWDLDSERVKERLEKRVSTVEFENVKRLVKLSKYNTPMVAELDEVGEIAIEIPADINELQNENMKLAIQWRKTTREAFLDALAQGYIVKEFFRGIKDGQKYGLYLLKRE